MRRFQHRIFHRTIALLLLVGSALFTGCNTTSSDAGETRYYVFTSNNNNTESDNFVVKTSDPAVIDKVEAQLDLPRDQRRLHIHGDIARGNAGYNKDWSWHFVAGQWDVVEVSTEVCDGSPQMVEEDLDYWVDTVGNFCPWSSIVLREAEAAAVQQ